jgi:hypothetical protein
MHFPKLVRRNRNTEHFYSMDMVKELRRKICWKIFKGYNKEKEE